MKLSIVIPTFNMCDGVGLTLDCLERLAPDPAVEVEVVVADDGSIDATRAVVEAHQRRMPDLRYVLIPRTEQSCASRARNLGVRHSRGELISFLDAGVVVGPRFASIVASRYQDRRDRVLLHHTYGLFAEPNTPLGAEARELFEQGGHDAVIARVEQVVGWMDVRQTQFELVDGELGRLPAPWAFAWTAALTVGRELFDKVSGFDDGGVDFAYRLSFEGAVWTAESEASAIHWPHPRAAFAGPERLLARRRKIHRVRYLLDSELYLYYPSRYLQVVLSRYEELAMSAVLPLYSESVLELVASTRPAGPTLLLGFDHPSIVRHLAFTHLAVQSRRAQAMLQRLAPGCEVLYSLCTDTEFEAGHFALAVINDCLRMQPPQLQVEMLRELSRISYKLQLIWTPVAGHVVHTPVETWDAGRWSSLADLDRMLAELGLVRRLASECSAVPPATPHVVYTIERG